MPALQNNHVQAPALDLRPQMGSLVSACFLFIWDRPGTDTGLASVQKSLIGVQEPLALVEGGFVGWH